MANVNTAWKLSAAVLFAVGCSAGSDNAAPATSSAIASASTTASASPASSWGAFPASARRDSAPPGIAQRAASEGDLAPAFSLPTTSGNWSLDEGLRQSSHVVLVFYRGDW